MLYWTSHLSVQVEKQKEGKMEPEQQLIQAAADGNVNKLEDILDKHPFSLNRFLVDWTPLHVAAARNHRDFVSHILKLTPELIDLVDSRNRTALHLASAKGKTEAAEILASASPELCLSRDIDGRNPLHLAAMGGHKDVLRMLVSKYPHAARVPADQGETILHLCVKGGNVETLKVLVESVVGDYQLLNATDGNGNTILHLAAAAAVQTPEMSQMLGYLLKNKRVEINVMNTAGKTVLDIVKEIPKGHKYLVPLDSDLVDRGAWRSKYMVRGEWLSKQQKSLMVVASLMATMAFQAGVSPPGGVWQDNKEGHRAGEAVLAYNYPNIYSYFLRVNTIGFLSSLSIIVLLMSGRPFKRKSHMWMMLVISWRVIMWLSITAIVFTYAFSILAVTPRKVRSRAARAMYVSILIWYFSTLIFFVLSNILLLKRREMRKTGSGTP